MGEVWRATDELLGRTVAVKLLSARHAGDDQFRDRFRAEARYAASLSHSGIARVFDYGESDPDAGDEARSPASRIAFLVMELVEGEPLSATIARDGALPADTTLDIVAQSARALAVAHEAGIVHRDIKPGNLLIGPDGEVKITDFGIARAALAAHLTQTGMVMGTAQYVSPEQASAQQVTAASDIYSLGVVAYECLAGRPPFTAEAPIALALAHVSDRPPPLPDGVPPQVAALVGQMLAKNPSDRPADAQAVAEQASALIGAAATERAAGAADPWTISARELAAPAVWFSEARPTTPVPAQPEAGFPARSNASPHRSRRPALLAAAVVLVAILAAGTVALVASLHQPATSPRGNSVAAHQVSPSTRKPVRTPSVTPSQTFPARVNTQPVTPSQSVSPSGSPSPSSSQSPTTSPSPSNSPTGSPSPTGSNSPSPTSSTSTQPSQFTQNG